MRLTALVIEDHQTVADAVKDTLEAEGWRVRLCADASTGRIEIESSERFDVLILDNQLPGGASGIELTRFARSLSHRRRTPVVILSGSYVEGVAMEAGADAFLRKPQDLRLLVETVRRLIQRGLEG
jgi:DNA-binding response OmpR family regulator